MKNIVIKSLQLGNVVTKIVLGELYIFYLQISYNAYCQKSCKLVGSKQRYCNNKKRVVFWDHSVYMCSFS